MNILAEQRLRLHHLLCSDLPGESPRRPLSPPWRQEDRPEACHTKSQEQRGQDEEDLCWRSEPGHLGRGGEEVFQSVRWVETVDQRGRQWECLLQAVWRTASCWWTKSLRDTAASASWPSAPRRVWTWCAASTTTTSTTRRWSAREPSPRRPSCRPTRPPSSARGWSWFPQPRPPWSTFPSSTSLYSSLSSSSCSSPCLVSDNSVWIQIFFCFHRTLTYLTSL